MCYNFGCVRVVCLLRLSCLPFRTYTYICQLIKMDYMQTRKYCDSSHRSFRLFSVLSIPFVQLHVFAFVFHPFRFSFRSSSILFYSPSLPPFVFCCFDDNKMISQLFLFGSLLSLSALNLNLRRPFVLLQNDVQHIDYTKHGLDKKTTKSVVVIMVCGEFFFLYMRRTSLPRQTRKQSHKSKFSK